MAVRNRASGALRLEQLAPRVVPQPYERVARALARPIIATGGRHVPQAEERCGLIYAAKAPSYH